ncbi:triosephosphate isomerase [Chlamydia pecorum W73]|uniref:triose-phosphate isomerase n=1 Tax=Chlamydia pecorum TaxID=85991 RepID=UPI0003ADD29B|nr:triose-phosphate isomerase [Chlamydia pecorum]AGW38727.1 triosephosphate isomerase [Chlamydia pecorum W73]
MVRERYVLGNWKMHKTCQSAEEYMTTLCPLLKKEEPPCHVGIAAPFTALQCCSLQIEKFHSTLKLGAQNVFQEPEGAFTGEISLAMLKEFYTSFVLLGHSERRQKFHEDNAIIAAKMQAVANSGLLPVLCIGESLETKEKGETYPYLEEQLMSGLEKFPKDAEVVLAYEPIWAIGTGRVAEAGEVQEIHEFCRRILARIFSEEKATEISILYGGSVKADNAALFGKCHDVDGLLVGGASLKPTEFFEVIKNFCRADSAC